MANKLIIGILVLVVIAAAGAGYYSFTLNQQIQDLSEQLSSVETEQLTQTDDLQSDLSSLRIETTNNISALEGSVDALGGNISTLGSSIGTLEGSISTLGSDISTLGSSIGTLERSVTAVEGNVSDLEESIDETQDDISALEAEQKTTQDLVAGLQEDVDDAVSQFATLEDQMAEFSVSAVEASDVYEDVIDSVVTIADGDNYAIGSGVIYDTQGHVITAYHVVENLSPIYVILHDGRVYSATDIGHCPYSDIAVLQLNGNPGITPPPLADSGAILIGEPVFSIGTPLDMRETFTAGVISQVNRATDYGTGYSIANLLQFDAPVNPGNSGGPLFNRDSEVVGITVARLSPTEGDGIHWAVASNKVRRVATDILTQSYCDYPWIGISVAELTPDLVRDLGLESIYGVLVAEVIVGSPAQDAGLEFGDIIVSMDGTPINDSGALTSYLGEFTRPGDMVTIGILRDGTGLEVVIEIGSRE
jgi:S1-C subfamily serine protease